MEGGEEVGVGRSVGDADDGGCGGEDGAGGGARDDGDGEGCVGEEGVEEVVADVVAAGAEDGYVAEGGGG